MLNALEVTALASSAANIRHFHSSPFLYYAVLLFDLFKDRHVTIMLHRGHYG